MDFIVLVVAPLVERVDHQHSDRNDQERDDGDCGVPLEEYDSPLQMLNLLGILVDRELKLCVCVSVRECVWVCVWV